MGGENGIWDCHLHIFAPSKSQSEGTEAQTLDEYMRTVAGPLAIKRMVFVQPSKLGEDHTVMFVGLTRLEGRARAIAVLPHDGASVDFNAWRGLGVRGLRYAPRLKQGGELERLLELGPTLAEMNWHVQVYADVDTLPEIVDKLSKAGIPIVLDHFARLMPGVASSDSATELVVDALRGGKCWIKLSAPYHFAAAEHCFGGLEALARKLFDANPGRILWGTDWPHPNVTEPVSERALLQALDVWGFDDAEKTKILLENPAALYA